MTSAQLEVHQAHVLNTLIQNGHYICTAAAPVLEIHTTGGRLAQYKRTNKSIRKSDRDRIFKEANVTYIFTKQPAYLVAETLSNSHGFTKIRILKKPSGPLRRFLSTQAQALAEINQNTLANF